MDSQTLYSVIERAISTLSSPKIIITDENEYSARVQVVSDDFKTVSISARIQSLYDLIYAKLDRNFALELEAWTHSEFVQMSKKSTGTGGAGSGGAGKQDQKKAALPQSDRSIIS